MNSSNDDHMSIRQLVNSLLDSIAHRYPSKSPFWTIIEENTTGSRLVDIEGNLFRMIGRESLSSGFSLVMLGANYLRFCERRKYHWPDPIRTILEKERARCGFFILTYVPNWGLGTVLEDSEGNYHLIEAPSSDEDLFWALLIAGIHQLVERPANVSRYDTFGDFLIPGAPSIIQRHSTERQAKLLSKKITYNRQLCSDCLQCATLCNEMRSLVTPQKAVLLGPSEDFCTHCGMCQKRCSYLVSEPRSFSSTDTPSLARILEGGTGVYIHGALADRFQMVLREMVGSRPSWWPYSTTEEWVRPEHVMDFPVRGQFILSGLFGERPISLTILENDENEVSVLIRSHYRSLVLFQTEEGNVEKDLISQTMQLGMDVRCLGEPAPGGAIPGLNEATRVWRRLNREMIIGQTALKLWQDREADVILAPFADRVSPELQRLILKETGRLAQLLSPHVRCALPFTRSPLLMQLSGKLADIYTKHPELGETEAQIARELLSNIPLNYARIHGRYRSMAFSSGHSACSSCAEAQVLAIPVYMAIAMSLARNEVPQVTFTCETGCMSETLNKVGEVAQRIPGGRTVFGGGFAFGEAIAMAQDRAIRYGSLPKSRRYVVSQGGDGGAVIGLPAWLNALRQQAYTVWQRYPNVLHFITITDTQVYSNTGGESSASSFPGMGTLTTPIGEFLLGNQKTHWDLINLAAEFPNVLVGAGHSANRCSMQQFWHLADQLGQSAIRWDVTPCPETGKFFGDDPDDLAEIMAHSGMIPEIVFYGRFRKRVAPYHPEDRHKPFETWRRKPQPITYWLNRDPRYRPLFKKNPKTGSLEPASLTAQFLITQLESYRDQLNRQIDLETHIINQAEQWVASFLDELKQDWKRYQYRPEQFRYAVLFNSRGEFKPDYDASLARELVIRMLGWNELAKYTSMRDRYFQFQHEQLEKVLSELRRLEEGSSQLVDTTIGESSRNPETAEIISRLTYLNRAMQKELQTLIGHLASKEVADPWEEELFALIPTKGTTFYDDRREALYRLLDRILEERALARFSELQQHRLARQLRTDFLKSGGIIKGEFETQTSATKKQLLDAVAAVGPFSIGVAGLAGDRGIAINRVFAGFLTHRGVWAGMAWQFGSSKRGTPVLSATFVDTKPIHRKDAMLSFPMAVMTVTNYEDMKRNPDLFFTQLMPGGFLIINHYRPAEELWGELIGCYPQEIRSLVSELRNRYSTVSAASEGWRKSISTAEGSYPEKPGDTLSAVLDEISDSLCQKPRELLSKEEELLVRKVASAATARLIVVDMDRIMLEVSGSSRIVSNLVAVAPIHAALKQLGLPLDWNQDLPLLVQGFPAAVLKNPKLIDAYYRAMAVAQSQVQESLEALGVWKGVGSIGGDSHHLAREVQPTEDDPGRYLMIMGGTLAGMVLSQIATAQSPLFYIGFPITPAGNPFYAMAEAFANGHPYIVVDEVNPSEKVAAEKLLGIARTGGFLPVTFTASQGWRLFTEIVPQFVGARLEGLFLIAKRALAAPNLNIEESHTDFMSFRDDGGIMLAPKSIQEYVPALYLARLLTHFAKLPVILSIGGVTDTHKISLVRVPPDKVVRRWLDRTLKGFDFNEHKLINDKGDLVVHGPSGTCSVYQETQSELEKAHQAAVEILPYALDAVAELTGTYLSELEVNSKTPKDQIKTLLILQGSLYPNATEALEELEKEGWTGMACMSVRFFNPFPERKLFEWFDRVERVVVLDRSNSFGSIPPLASRILCSFARYQTLNDPGRKLSLLTVEDGTKGALKSIRIMVGGLGGREITVEEIKEILLSTHLLFHPLEAWEKPLLHQWLEEDTGFRSLIEETAACELRNTDRHTRVTPHLRSGAEREEEFRRHLDEIYWLLRNKEYRTFLANYNQVEFIGAREILQESVLRYQIVKELEVRLAREALENGNPSARHLLILLCYGRRLQDRQAARDGIAAIKDADSITPILKASFGIPTDLSMLRNTQNAQAFSKTLSSDMERATRPGDFPEYERKASEIDFSGDERKRIEDILVHMTSLADEQALYYNPEDYEHELIRILSKDSSSQYSTLKHSLGEDGDSEFLQEYLSCYRNVIDRTLQREILCRHHAPELQELFEGEGLELLFELTREIRSHLRGESGDISRIIAEEVENYLITHRLPRYPLPALFYLEYFRNWVLPELVSGSD